MSLIDLLRIPLIQGDFERPRIWNPKHGRRARRTRYAAQRASFQWLVAAGLVAACGGRVASLDVGDGGGADVGGNFGDTRASSPGTTASSGSGTGGSGAGTTGVGASSDAGSSSGRTSTDSGPSGGSSSDTAAGSGGVGSRGSNATCGPCLTDSDCQSACPRSTPVDPKAGAPPGTIFTLPPGYLWCCQAPKCYASRRSTCPDMPCVPTTCADRGAACGWIDDGCGRSFQCGTCSPGAACTGGHCM
jgi:hypothetical protein